MNSADSELQALISLLDDPDDLVFNQVRSKLEDLGQSIIPLLESACENHTYGPLFESRAEELITYIQNNSRVNKLSKWVHSDEQDLLEGLVSLAQYQYPEVTKESLEPVLEKLEKDIWLELNDDLTGLEKLKVINHILFDVHSFVGNKEDYHHPDNSFINQVLSNKKGNPISLSALYLVLAKRLKLPIFGINLPRHFILAWGDEFSLIDGRPTNEIDILFYFNPFSEGAVFGKMDISAFLKEINIDENPAFFKPCNNVDILYRFLNNLSYSYQMLNQADKVEEINSLKQALKK